MFDFNKVLTENEKIIYKSKPIPGKANNSIKGPVLGILFVLVCQALLILSVVFKIGDGANGVDFSFIIIFGVTVFFNVICIYSIIYTLFLKKRKVADDHYCITNKRVLKYEDKKEELVYGYLLYYETITAENVLDGFGDVSFISNQINEDEVVSALVKPNKENMPYILFQSIPNPKEVVKIAKNAREKLLNQKENN